jgi:Lambda phage tail tube protein, TTP
MPSAVETVAGTTIGISATKPATYNIVGYDAVVFSTIGEITDGGTHGRVYAEVTHNPIATRGTQKFKGSFNEGTKTIQMAVSNSDAGQVLLQTALASDASFSFKVTYQGGDIDYFQARVLSFEKAAASVDSIVSATVQLSLTTTAAGVGIVTKLAA